MCAFTSHISERIWSSQPQTNGHGEMAANSPPTPSVSRSIDTFSQSPSSVNTPAPTSAELRADCRILNTVLSVVIICLYNKVVKIVHQVWYFLLECFIIELKTFLFRLFEVIKFYWNAGYILLMMVISLLALVIQPIEETYSYYKFPIL